MESFAAREKTGMEKKDKKILDAARVILANNGYMKTTIAEVAGKAGVSRGLVHYYFKNKEDMLAKVLKANMEASIFMIIGVFEHQRSAAGYARAMTGMLKDVMKRDPDFFHLFFEGFAVARQSRLVKQELESLYVRFRQALEKCLIRAEAQRIIEPGIGLKSLAALLTGLIDGLGLQLLTEPELLDDETWADMEAGIKLLLGG